MLWIHDIDNGIKELTRLVSKSKHHWDIYYLWIFTHEIKDALYAQVIVEVATS